MYKPCAYFLGSNYIHPVYPPLCEHWAPSQYPKRRLSVRSRKVSKPRDRYFELSYRFEIWQAHRQHCCRSACQISERSGNSKYKSRGFETLRDLTERRLFGYWDGALVSGDNIYLFIHLLIYMIHFCIYYLLVHLFIHSFIIHLLIYLSNFIFLQCSEWDALTGSHMYLPSFSLAY